MNPAFISIKKDEEWVPLVGEKFGDYTFNLNDKVRASDEWWYTGDKFIGIFYDKNEKQISKICKNGYRQTCTHVI